MKVLRRLRAALGIAEERALQVDAGNLRAGLGADVEQAARGLAGSKKIVNDQNGIRYDQDKSFGVENREWLPWPGAGQAPLRSWWWGTRR